MIKNALVKKIANNADATSWSGRCRQARMAPLLPFAQRPLRVIDLGGTPAFWKALGGSFPHAWQITTLNLGKMESTEGFTCLTGDVLQFSDYASYDLIFSNSLIEHLGTWANKLKLAQAIVKSGKPYFVQTPNYWFPIEPHFIFPAFQFLPRQIQRWLLMSWDIGWSKKMDRDGAYAILDEIGLLTRADLLRLFPGGSLFHEKIFGLTKSFVAYDLRALSSR